MTQKGFLAALGMTMALLSAPAPVFAADAPRLKGEIDAKELSALIAREKGKVVLVNFWATWCVPCREEFPDLVKLEAEHRGKGVAVIGVSTDLERETPAVEKFLATHNPGFANYRKRSGGDDQEFIDAVDKDWGGELPFSVLYAKDGRKAKVLSGKQSRADFEREVAKLLGESAPNR